MASVSDEEVLRGIYRWDDVRTHEFWCTIDIMRTINLKFIDRLIFRGTNLIAEAKEDEAFSLFVDMKKRKGLLRISSRTWKRSHGEEYKRNWENTSTQTRGPDVMGNRVSFG